MPKQGTDTFMESPWMNTPQAAEYLQLTERSLIHHRARNTGPTYHRAGSRTVRYHRSELDQWVTTAGNEA